MRSDDAYRRIAAELTTDPAVSEAKMMGTPSLKYADKMFGGLRDGRLVVKLGRDRVDALVAEQRARPFDPSGRGRPMKDWAQLLVPEDEWSALAQEALALARRDRESR